MIKFEHIKSSLVKILKDHGIKEEDLRTHHSDLYVGCKNMEQAQAIHDANGSGAVVYFTPQEGSDMDHYPVALDFPFAAMTYDFEQKHGKRFKE